MKAFYLEIYPVLDVKLDETEAERFPLLWNYLFDEVINHSFSMTLLSTSWSAMFNIRRFVT